MGACSCDSCLQSALVQVQAPGELFKLWRAGKVPLLFVAYSWMLSQVADALGVQPGEEFRVALLEAQKVRCLCCPRRRTCHLCVPCRNLCLGADYVQGHWQLSTAIHCQSRPLKEYCLCGECRLGPRWCWVTVQCESRWLARGVRCRDGTRSDSSGGCSQPASVSRTISKRRWRP